MKVISIEGIDGTGKTALYEGLKDKLASDDKCFMKFPTKRFYKKYLELDKDQYRLDRYFQVVNDLQTEDKAHFYNHWKQQGKKVMICDRYDVSQKVYDGSNLVGQTVEVDMESDFVIYLSTDIETSMKRINKRNAEDMLGYEEKEKLIELKSRYERVLNEEYQGRHKVIEIKPEDTIEDVLSMVLAYIDKSGLLV